MDPTPALRNQSIERSSCDPSCRSLRCEVWAGNDHVFNVVFSSLGAQLFMIDIKSAPAKPYFSTQVVACLGKRGESSS